MIVIIMLVIVLLYYFLEGKRFIVVVQGNKFDIKDIIVVFFDMIYVDGVIF